MHYRGRHRQVANRQQRLRRTSTVAAITASAVIAPLAFSAPVASQAHVTATAYDTLANHPEWRLSEANPEVTAQIASLQQALTERGVTYDPAKVAAYRVPTVEGFTTFVTVTPENMTVRPNPDLLERTPEGAQPVDPAVVLERLLAPAVQNIGGGGGIDLPYVELLNDDIWQSIDPNKIPKVDVWALVATINKIIDDNVNPTIPSPDLLVAQIRAVLDPLVIEALRQAGFAIAKAVELLNTLPTTDALVQAVLNIADIAVRALDGMAQYALDVVESMNLLSKVYALLDQVPSDPNVVVAKIQALLDSVPPLPPIDPLGLANEIQRLATAQVDALLGEVGLSDLNDLELSAIVTEVVPFAAAAPPGPSEIMANPNLPDGARDDNNGSSASWSRRGGDCYKVSTEAFWRIVCWRIDGQDKDNDSSHNYWQLHLDSSGKSVGYRDMERMWVEAVPGPRGASNQSWNAVAKPSAQYGGSQGCTTSGENVSVASGAPVQVGFGFYWERTSCENYYPKSYGDDDGHWATVWEGNPNVKPEVHRAVMVKVPVKTPADKGVMWEFLTGQRTD
ncbi:MAG TPA: hypothetical protein VNA20_16285 [Frankiaceae bacterium]|nr:hypothetical protein [Frankiaceae bacterium]